MTTVALQIFLLGEPHFVRDDQPVDLSAGKATALLAYLALTHTPQSRDQVLALLWPESLAEAARKNLRNTLWAIRKTLGSDVFSASDDRLSLNSSIWIDTTEFERLAEIAPESALTLYSGPLLAHLDVHDAPEFEIWMTIERERLGQIHLRLISQLLERYRTTGDWALISALAHRALGEDMLNEQMYQALIEAHARLGERGEALRHYDTLRTTLSRELGVEPLPETERLRAMILNGGLEPVQPARLPRPAMRDRNRNGTHNGTAHAPFVGRQAERTQLDTELAAALAGEVRILLLTGEIGIGKSRLWQEWSAQLPGDLAIFETACLDSTQTLPFAPLTRMFNNKLCMKRLSEGTVPPIWLAELARLLPEIRAAQPQIPVPVALPPEEERRRVFETFVQLLSSMGRLVLFIDDLHWADAATIDWLSYFINRWQEQGLLLVATYRQEDAPASLIRLVANWTRQGLLHRLPLARLTGDESAQLLAALGADLSQSDQFYAQSAGNPYFLTELVHAPPGTMPPALAESVRARVGSLPDAARQVLQAAAVLEPDFSFNLLRRTSGRGEEEMLDALDTLLNAGVLVERDQRYGFAHPLVAQIVRDNLSDARRTVLHRRAAEALEAVYADRLPLVAGQLTEHYAQAHDADCAAHYAQMAAERSLELAAPAEAVSFYRRALSFEPTPERQLDLGRALIWQGNLSEGQTVFEIALEGFQAAKDRQGMLRAYLALGDSYLPAGRPAQVIYWAEKSLAYLNSRGIQADPADHALALLQLGGGQLRIGHTLAEAEAHLAQAAQIAADNDLSDMAARSSLELGNLRAQRGDLAGALEAFHETIIRSQIANNPYLEILGYNNAAYHYLLTGNRTAAHQHIETGLALAETRAVRLPLQYLYSTRGEIALAEKAWDVADTYFNKGLAEAALQNNTEQIATYRANLSLVARGRGDLDRSLQLLESARELATTLTAPHLQIQIDLWTAELFLAREERAAAQEALVSAETRLADGSRKHLHTWADQLQTRLAHG